LCGRCPSRWPELIVIRVTCYRSDDGWLNLCHLGLNRLQMQESISSGVIVSMTLSSKTPGISFRTDVPDTGFNLRVTWTRRLPSSQMGWVSGIMKKTRNRELKLSRKVSAQNSFRKVADVFDDCPRFCPDDLSHAKWINWILKKLLHSMESNSSRDFSIHTVPIPSF